MTAVEKKQIAFAQLVAFFGRFLGLCLGRS
jgi:hypothetical protein